MTTMSQAAAQPAMPYATSGFLRWFGAGALWLAAYLDRRAAVKALRQLDDRELRDIGLVRSHIEQAVWGHVDAELGRLR
jgi:uncharacterized protein YjiS (DUF1127 family)